MSPLVLPVYLGALAGVFVFMVIYAMGIPWIDRGRP